MSNESKSLFSDMEDLGFGDIKNINLYQQPEDDEKMDDEKKSPLQDSVKKKLNYCTIKSDMSSL